MAMTFLMILQTPGSAEGLPLQGGVNIAWPRTSREPDVMGTPRPARAYRSISAAACTGLDYNYNNFLVTIRHFVEVSSGGLLPLYFDFIWYDRL